MEEDVDMQENKEVEVGLKVEETVLDKSVDMVA